MSKYIIDTDKWANLFDVQKVGVYGIGNDIVTDEKTVWSRMFRLDELEELNSDYINENYGSLQDEAYQKGYEDGKKSTEKGCEGCKYEGNASEHLPCEYCMNNFKSQWTAKQKDRIEVGDEVIWTTDNITLIVTSMYEVGGINWCDGLAQDGKVYSTLIENDCKTGKHYDIQSILDAMKQ